MKQQLDGLLAGAPRFDWRRFLPRPDATAATTAATTAGGDVAGPAVDDAVLAAAPGVVGPGRAARHWLPTLGMRAALGLALLLVVAMAGLALVRLAHDGRVYPAIVVGGMPLGGLTYDEANAQLTAKAANIAAIPVSLSAGDQEWRTTLGAIGISVDTGGALARAFAVGREETAWERLRATASLVRADTQIALPMQVDAATLGAWFDQIDRELAMAPHNASLRVTTSGVEVVPEVDGTVVDRAAATATLTDGLRYLQPVVAALPTQAIAPIVRVADLEPARVKLATALSGPVQVSFESGIWTLPATDLAQFVTQTVDPNLRGAPAFTVGLDRGKLAAWLDERLAGEINREPADAEVGWNGERVVSTEMSVDGVTLDPVALAEAVEASFFSNHVAVPATVSVTKPTIDSNNLAALGITTVLAKGTSNYSGSSDGRATNVEVGARLLNGTLIPPHGTFSFNNSIGYITKDKGYVEAQVIDGETIGQDIGGGICQVSTTAFRAAYLAGMPITEWWPHRFRIGFYEYDGWPPGLDASILQPTEDPATWGDFKFENPTDSWLLVESWADGVNVVVVIYGADLGWQIVTEGPTEGERFIGLRDEEIVDPELEPNTIKLTGVQRIGEEFSHYRVVYDRSGDLLWERTFYTKFYPQGNTWLVSPDMRGKSPADPSRPADPLPPREEEAVSG